MIKYLINCLKIFWIVLPLLVVGGAVGGVVPVAFAQQQGQQNETDIEKQQLAIPNVSRIGIIDVEAVLRRSLVWADFLEKVETRRAKAQGDIVKRQTALELEGKELTQVRATLSADDFAKRRESYFNKVQKLQQDTQTIKKELDAYFVEGRDIVYKNLNDILAEVGKDYNLSMIIDKKTPSIILYADKRIVLNDLVLGKLNKRIWQLDK